jgi:hypothetical protein
MGNIFSESEADIEQVIHAEGVKRLLGFAREAGGNVGDVEVEAAALAGGVERERSPTPSGWRRVAMALMRVPAFCHCGARR